MSSEFDYLEYREQRQSFRGTFKHDRENLIINRDGHLNMHEPYL